jgi:2-polyprenyl-3-methyl-5-hydroxy-6-metoxy-1,4-benzoquinol methylase
MIKDKILSYRKTYSALMSLLASPRSADVLINEYIKPRNGLSFLDVGCGPASILDLLPNISYVGIDQNENYINYATTKYGAKGTFICAGVDQLNDHGFETFDRIIIIGVMHHLDDTQLTKLMKSLKDRLNPKGTLITFDPAYEDKQNLIAKFLAKNDRGKFVRTKDQYLKFIKSAFSVERADLHHDLLRVPYTHLITRSSAQ